jgi:hypothetical protein
MVEKIAHSRGFTVVLLEFVYPFKLKVFKLFCVKNTFCPNFAVPPCTYNGYFFYQRGYSAFLD